MGRVSELQEESKPELIERILKLEEQLYYERNFKSSSPEGEGSPPKTKQPPFPEDREVNNAE